MMPSPIVPSSAADDQSRRPYLYLVASMAAVSGFLFGYDLAIISGAIIFLKEVFQLDPAQEGFAMGSATLGCLVGPPKSPPPACAAD
jgi:hypothetical protein